MNILPLLILAFGFLGVLFVVTAALVKTLRSTQADGAQRSLAGVLLVLGVGAAGAIGLGGFAASVGAVALTAFVRHGPVQSVEIVRAGEAPLDTYSSDLERRALEALGEVRETRAVDPRWPVHVLVEYVGDPDVDRIERWLRRETHGEVDLVSTRPLRERSPCGEPMTLIDFGLDFSERELERFEREFETQPFFDLPHGMRIEVRRP